MPATNLTQQGVTHLKLDAWALIGRLPQIPPLSNQHLLFVASTISGELNLVFYLLSYANKNLQGSNKRKRKHLQSRNNVKDSPEVSAGIHPVPRCQMLEAESLKRAHAPDHVLMGCSLETKTQPVFDVNIYLPVAIMQCNTEPDEQTTK